MQRQTRLTFFFHTEAWRLHFGEREAEVLVQVIQFINEISYITSQHLHHTETGVEVK